MKKITINDIRAFNPCYDPTRYLPEDWEGTVMDILRVTECPAEDRLWVVCRKELIDERTLRLFAVWCAREALKLINEPDPRRINACDVAERYANGEANDNELSAARNAAMNAAWDAAWDAAGDAAGDAARDAADAAAEAAAWAAAEDAAEAAAWDAARDAQIDHLIYMLSEAQS